MIRQKYVATLALIIVMLAQLACGMFVLELDKMDCENKGGRWVQRTNYKDEVVGECVMSPTATSQGGGNTSGGQRETPSPPVVEPTGKYMSPTPALAGECNATAYLQAEVEIVKNTRDTYYRECEYRLNIVNTYPNQPIWIVRHTNTTVYSSALDSESNYWYSDLVAPGKFWEKQFRSNYYTDGQFSREGVDMIAGVYDRPECLYLLTSEEIMAISRLVEWTCGP